MRKIILITTFKEFDGGHDAEIQKYWLNQLQYQTYTNFELFVVNYREKHVYENLKNSNIPFVYVQSDYNCKFSWTDITERSLDIVKTGENIILWITPDHMMDSNFLEAIATTFEVGTGGTSFPNSMHLGIEDYQKGIMYDEYYDRKVSAYFEYNPNKHIPEVFYCDADLLLDKKWRNALVAHHTFGPAPGVSLHVYFQTLPKKIVNILYLSKVHKIINHVESDNLTLSKNYGESHNWSPENVSMVTSYAEYMGISKKYIYGSIARSAKLFAFQKYSVIGSVRNKMEYYTYSMKYTLYPHGRFIIYQKIITFYSLMINYLRRA